jgi:uncharacterized repeat protein (TIGR01451 family)
MENRGRSAIRNLHLSGAAQSALKRSGAIYSILLAALAVALLLLFLGGEAAAHDIIAESAADPGAPTAPLHSEQTITGGVLINEIVTDPQQDWSANDFNGEPGMGDITRVDEWLELYVITDGLDLTDWTIVLSDSTPVSGDLATGGAFQVSNYITTGGGSFTDTAAGDYLVLGNVASDAQMNNAIWIILRDGASAVIDQVELGDDPQNDGAGDGAPDGSDDGGDATDIFDEAVARVPNGVDTDDDVQDFRRQRATMGASNDFVELTIAKSVSPDPAIAGLNLLYTVTVSNRGSQPAADVVLSDTLPPSLTLYSVDQTDNDSGSFSFSNGTHQNTVWDTGRAQVSDDDWLHLEDTLTPTGVYTSSVMDAYNWVDWSEMVWWPRRPYWKPLPNGGQSETFYDLGNADMTGNSTLLHLDEISGAAVFSDSSGLGHYATCPAAISETCPTAIEQGRFNGALHFDGALSQTVVITDEAEPARYAIELWVRPATVTDTSFILRTDALSGTRHNFSHLLGISGGKFFHYVDDGRARQVFGSTDVMTDTWYHLVGVAQSGGDLELYVNGEREGRRGGIGALWEGGDQYRMGSAFGSTETLASGSYFSGAIDEVAIYSRTLSSAEIRDHYLRGALRLRFQVRVCDDAACEGEAFFGPGGLTTTHYSEMGNMGLTTAPSAALPDSLGRHRYLQYRAFLETDVSSYSPELHQVEFRPGHRAVTATQGSCFAASSSSFTCTLDAIPSGAVVTVTAGAHIHPSALGVITNTAAVTAPLDFDPSNNVTLLTSTVDAETDLVILKQDDESEEGEWANDLDFGWDVGGKDPVSPGELLTYTLRVRNDGPSTARAVTVTDELPGGMVGYASSDSGWVCGPPANIITCTLDSMLPTYGWQGLYDWEHIVITATAPPTIGVITNTAWVTSTTFETITDTADNSVTETTTIMPVADVSIDKSDSPDPVDPQSTLHYTVTVTNHGPYTATGVVVTDTLPTGLAGHVFNADGWSCSTSDGRLMCELESPLTATLSASFNLTVTAPISGFLDNSVHVTADQHDPDEDNNWDAAYTVVRPVTDLAIGKWDAPDPVDAAAALTYTIVVTNEGPLPAGAYSTTIEAQNDNTLRVHVHEGRAAPYRSSIFLNSVPGLVGDLTVTLHDVSHSYPSDLSVLLVGPDERAVVLMANAGGGSRVEDLTLTFSDDGVPMAEPLTSTVYAPTNNGFSKDFVPPAPEGPYGSSLSTFYSGDPNGHWRLYVYDNVYSDGGEIGGWSLRVRTLTTDTVTLTDTLPAGLTDPSIEQPTGWDCDLAVSPLTCTGDWLAVGDPAVFTIKASAPITPGIITNTAAITSTTTDFWMGGNGFPNSATVTTTVRAVADLVIDKHAHAPAVLIADPLTYTLTVSNAGPSPAEGPITVTDRLPAGLTDVSAGGCDLSALPLVTCTLGGLAPGEATEIIITATAPLTPSIVITNSASVTTSVPDPDPIDNTALVSVTVEDLPVRYVYLPLVMRNYAVAPDLVVDSIVATSNGVTVTISNQGDAPVTGVITDEFWVDVYIDPDSPPTGVNQTWEMLGSQGLVWGVEVGTLPLEPGESRTLTVGDASFRAEKSEVSWPLSVGTPIWAQVDSANADTDYGAVLENHEIIGVVYNNIISGTVN